MNGKQLAVVLAFIGAAALLMNHQGAKTSGFEAWKAQHGISFSSEIENAYRERVFLENLAKIEAHNADKTQTYEQGLNQFSALTQEEFVQSFLGLTLTDIPEGIDDEYEVADNDWTTQGAVTGVKNQGNCGSCWAFSTTGGLEGLSKIGHGSLQSFSEQQLVDCSSSYGNQACNGGLMTSAYKFVKASGITTEASYPYKAVKQTCKASTGTFKISGYTAAKACSTLASAITGRPISVSVDATNWSAYKSGTFSNCKTSLNHGVTLVGVISGDWKVKNSWGTSWGEKGFIRVKSGNTCGICADSSYPNK